MKEPAFASVATISSTGTSVATGVSTVLRAAVFLGAAGFFAGAFLGAAGFLVGIALGDDGEPLQPGGLCAVFRKHVLHGVPKNAIGTLNAQF